MSQPSDQVEPAELMNHWISIFPAAVIMLSSLCSRAEDGELNGTIIVCGECILLAESYSVRIESDIIILNVVLTHQTIVSVCMLEMLV